MNPKTASGRSQFNPSQWFFQKCIFQIEYQALVCDFYFFSIWVFFYEHLQFTGHHFDPLHRHLHISRAIAAESSPLHIANIRD